MRGNRSRDTAPEVAVRKALYALGLRYRVAYRPEAGLRRTADIVFPRARVAVFIDGCFWHGCLEHYVQSKTNTGYWHPKIEANRQRDIETTAILKELGWTVMRFWSHESPADVAKAVYLAVTARNGHLRSSQPATNGLPVALRARRVSPPPDVSS
jgi:DNA mismatch endonuclease (patch repair protein)